MALARVATRKRRGWGLTTQVKIIYDQKPRMIDEPPVAACQMLFRFADHSGRDRPPAAPGRHVELLLPGPLPERSRMVRKLDLIESRTLRSSMSGAYCCFRRGESSRSLPVCAHGGCQLG